MNSKSVLILTLRIGAVVILVSQLDRIPYSYQSYYIDGVYKWFASIGHLVLPTLLSLLFSALFWFYPEKFLKNLPMDEEDQNSKELSSTDFTSLLIGIVGLYIVAMALADIIYHLTYLKIGMDQFGSSFEVPIQDKSALIASIAEIILGLILFFGGHFIAFLIARFQKETSKDF